MCQTKQTLKADDGRTYASRRRVSTWYTSRNWLSQAVQEFKKKNVRASGLLDSPADGGGNR
jgi:hypothetical protein